MTHHRHNLLHRRAGGNVWDDFTKGVADLNPFKDSPQTLQAKANGPSTVYQTIYTTLPPTFTEQVAGYSTVGSGNNAPATTLPTTLLQASSKKKSTPTPTPTPTPTADDTELPTSLIPTATADPDVDTSLALATSTPAGVSNTNVAGAITAGTSSASPTSTATSSASDNGTSDAAKAGIAIGVLGGLLVFGLLAWFLFNKRRKQMEQQRAADDEKINGPFGAAAVARRDSERSIRTNATAPQLSLRPVTQFMPNFGERRSSKGAAMALAAGSAANRPQPGRPVGNSLWERPMAGDNSNHHENPFGAHAERLDAVSERSVQGSTPDLQPANPFNAPENVVGMAQTTNSPPKPSPVGVAAAATAAASGAAAGAALTRKQSTRKDAPQALDLTMAGNAINSLGPVPAPASPAGTEFSMTEVDPGQSPGPSTSAAAIAAAGGPPQSTVHRVQLDFKPTLDDELDLKAGQLVRLLHEYDDGWALCIRLDRSKQGVCPRTCLSTRPVKPRPNGPPGTRNGPPVNPNGPRGPPRGSPRGPGPNFPPGQRPMTPQGGPPGGRPQSPAMMRPQSPAGMPRPQSPANMNRSQSPGPRERGYSQGSANGRRMSPPGLSPMNPASGNSPPRAPQAPIGRKPVPGQAY